MKKLVSLGIVSAMVTTMAVPALAVKEVSGKSLSDIKVYVLEDQAINVASATEQTPGDVTINGNLIKDGIAITARNSHTYKVVFGISATCPFGTGSDATKPVNQEIFRASNSNPVTSGSNELSGTSGVKIVKGKLAKINAGSGDYLSAYGITITGTNSSTTERYSVYPITLKDSKNNTRVIKLCITAPAFDKDDTSEGEGDTTDDGYREFAGSTALYNGHTIGAATLKEMQGKGNYKFTGAKGVDVLASISKATVEAGKTAFNASISLDSALDARYNADGKNKIFRTTVGMFPAESRKVNIKCDNQAVIDLLTSEFCEKITDSNIKKLYVYPINAANYDTLASASANDGIINTDEVIVATVSDGRIVFTLPKNVTDVMVSLKEIDTTKLAAIPGVSVPETVTSAVNEITAPVIDTTSTESATSAVTAPVATVTAPTVVSSPVLSSVPAGSGVAQNTGANDVIAVAIALAAISMAAAGVVASKKF